MTIFCALCCAPADAAVNRAAVMAKAEMPPVERQWTERDYDAVVKLMRQSQPGDLPRPQSAVMQRLLDPQNLEGLNDASAPLEVRLRRGSRLVASTTEVLRLYLSALETDASRNDDIIWIEGFMMQEASILVKLADQELAAVDPSTSGYAERAATLNEMKRGLREVVVGCIMALQSKSPASEEARKHLAGIMHAEWPKIAPLLSSDARNEIENALKLFSENEPDPGVKAAFAGS